jgi:hypothetical protein
MEARAALVGEEGLVNARLPGEKITKGKNYK